MLIAVLCLFGLGVATTAPRAEAGHEDFYGGTDDAGDNVLVIPGNGRADLYAWFPPVEYTIGCPARLSP